MALMKGIDSDKKVVDVLLTAEGSLTNQGTCGSI